MNYHHFDHLDEFAEGMRVGVKFKKGDFAGYNGKSGTSSPHCHYEVMNQRPNHWLQYPWNWSRDKVLSFYLDPMQFVTNTLPMKWNKFGYRFLDSISRVKNGKTEYGFHPGVDLNWGSGMDDFRLPLYFTTDGVIEYVGRKETDGGAGNNLWWREETEEQPMEYENMIVFNVETGEFALVLKGVKRVIPAARQGLAALTAQLRSMKGAALTREAWDTIPTGENF